MCIFPEIDKLQSIFWRLNVVCEIQVKRLPMTSSGKYIIGNFYYTGGNYKEEPYFLVTIIGYTQENFIQHVIQTFSGYDIFVTSIDNPQNDFQLKIPRFQTPSQLKMILDIRGTE